MTTVSIHSKPTEIKDWYLIWRAQQIKAGNILDSVSDVLLTDWYADQIISGAIYACEDVVWACKRHKKDLERAGTEDFPYIFDKEKAHRPIRFIEKFCKPSKGDFFNIILQPWQHFALGSLYGWVHKDTGLRRFKEGLIFVPRKAGKTTTISGLTTYAVSKDGERGARVYVLANAKQQARELYDEARAMVQASPSLKKRMKETGIAITHPQSKSKIEPRASDSKKLDGLNTSFAVFDEIHEFTNYKLINVIKRSWSARKQPLLVYITTAGYELDGPLVDFVELGKDVVRGVVDQDSQFYLMYSMDNIKEIENPELWVKANPNIGVTSDLPSLVKDYNTDKLNPGQHADWITKQFNIFADNDELSFLDYDTLIRNDGEFNPDDLIGKQCIGGYDLSNTEDFTSACLEFPMDDGSVAVISHSWIPRKKSREDDSIPYEEYERMGLLTICEKDYVEEDIVEDWFIEMSKKYSIQKIAFDNYNAFRLNKSLEAKGFEMVKIIQGHKTLNAPMKNLKEIFIDGKVKYNKNKLFRWYINNVKLVMDRNGNWMPTKQGKNRKIDGFAAFLNAHVLVMEMMVNPAGSGEIEFVSFR